MKSVLSTLIIKGMLENIIATKNKCHNLFISQLNINPRQMEDSIKNLIEVFV